jgi:hypothetical protein
MKLLEKKKTGLCTCYFSLILKLCFLFLFFHGSKKGGAYRNGISGKKEAGEPMGAWFQ